MSDARSSQLSRGLSVTSGAPLTTEEQRDFRGFYAKHYGELPAAVDFWLEHDQAVLRKYRQFAAARVAPETDESRQFSGFGFLEFNALTGYVSGIRYNVFMWQELGLTREAVLEGVDLARLQVGSQAMQTIEQALSGFRWIQPSAPPQFPDGWTSEPARLKSGLDFDSPGLTRQESSQLGDWYLHVCGEMPAWIRGALAEAPQRVKDYRAIFETAIKTLPVQVVAYGLLHFNVIVGSGPGIREGLLLARGLGMTREQALETVFKGALYGGMAALSITQKVAGDVLEKW